MTSSPVLTLALRYGGILTAAVALVGATIGYFVAGMPGVFSALVGALLTAVFLGLTAVSILVASKVAKGENSITVFFGIVIGVWLAKLVLFVVVAIALRGQPWLDPYVFFGVVIVAVVGSLIADGFAVQRARVPHVEYSTPAPDAPPLAAHEGDAGAQ